MSEIIDNAVINELKKVCSRICASKVQKMRFEISGSAYDEKLLKV